MRVLEVVQGLGRGGAERSLIHRLDRAPVQLESRILNLRPELDELSEPDVRVIRHDGSRIAQRSALIRAIAGFEPQVIVIRTPRDLLIAASLSRRQLRGARLIFEAHSQEVTARHGLVASLLNQAVVQANKRIDLHLAVSKRVADGPLCRGARNIVMQYLGSDVDLSVPNELPEVRGTHFLFLGRFVELKRPGWLVDRVANARQHFRQSGSLLSMVGGGPLWPQVSAQVHDLGIQDIVHVRHPVDEPGCVLRTTDVLVIPSMIEGLPLTVFEAKQAGLRILTTPAGGTTELLAQHDRVTSDFGETTFESALIAEIVRGFQSDGDRRVIQEQAKEFSTARTAERFYALLESQI